MKKLIAILTLAFVAACPAGATAQGNLKNDPACLAIDGAFDFKAIKPEVNINLPKFLLNDALADLDGGKNDPFAGTDIKLSELIQDIKLIRLVVMEGNKTNNEAITKGVATIKSTLDKEWTPVAVVAEDDETVGVYAISDPTGESTAGVAVLIHEKNGDAIVANIVGRISLGKVLKAASKMDKFPKDLLKKLTSAAETEGAKTSEERPKDPAN